MPLQAAAGQEGLMVVALKVRTDWRREEMAFSFSRTMESPCRTCDNVHLSKEECAKDCSKLEAFQDAILRQDERNIEDFEMKYGYSRS